MHVEMMYPTWSPLSSGALHQVCLLLWTTLLTLTTTTTGSKILLLTVPMSRGSKSHMDLMVRLGDTLAERGHQVTIVVQGEQTVESELLTQDRCPSAVNRSYADWYGEELGKLTPSLLRGQTLNRETMRKFGALFLRECRQQLRSEQLMQKHRRQGFDLAVIDHSHLCGYLYARRLGVRYVTLECSSYLTLLADTLTPAPLAYVPVFTSRLTDRMGFGGRLRNVLMSIVVRYLVVTAATAPYDELMRERGIAPGLSAQQLREQAELWLVNSDVAFDFPRPLMPNTVLVGGMLAKPPGPLQPDLEVLVSAAGTAGFIVVCFGSSLDLSQMPDLLQLFYKALRDLPQHIIWGSSFIPSDSPPNFTFMPWIPQQDLLGHAATRAFITHGGVNSLLEAVYHGVPAFVVPSTADAFDNVLRLEKKGMLLWRQYNQLTEENLRADVIAIVNDKRYKERASHLSSILKDQPLKPTDRAAFWVEHVIKHGGGGHLRSAAFDLQLYELYMLDVIAFLLVSLLVALLGLLFCCRHCFRRFQSLFPAHPQPPRKRRKSHDDLDDCHHKSSHHDNQCNYVPQSGPYIYHGNNHGSGCHVTHRSTSHHHGHHSNSDH